MSPQNLSPQSKIFQRAEEVLGLCGDICLHWANVYSQHSVTSNPKGVYVEDKNSINGKILFTRK